MKNIKAIIFDWGGVLIDNPEPTMAEYCSHVLGVTERAFESARNKHVPDFDRALISEVEFWQRMANDLGVKPPDPPTLWGEAFRRAYSPRPRVFSWGQQLRAKGYKIGLLSNAELPAMEHFYKQNYRLFDAVTFSCIEGVRKPDPVIYQRALAKVGTAPHETIYLDDKQINIDAANTIGIHGYRVQTTRDIQQVLKKNHQG